MVFLHVQSTRRSDRFWQDAKICRVWGSCPQTQSPKGETPVPSSRGSRTKTSWYCAEASLPRDAAAKGPRPAPPQKLFFC